MMPLLFAGIGTTFLLLVDIYMKTIKSFWKYCLFFLLCLFGGLIQQAYANPFSPRYFVASKGGIKIETKQEETKVKTVRECQKELMAKCKEKMDYHFEEGIKCLKAAEDACIWLPTKTAQEKASLLFLSLMAALSAHAPKEKVLSALFIAATEYGLAVMFEWQFVDAKLQQAKMNFDLEEFYRIHGNHVYQILKAEKLENGE